jgi:RNA polymerase-binding transcription factor DksA
MHQYKLKRTLSEFRRRLALYSPNALREAKRALQKIEEKHEIIPDYRDADFSAEKELLIAQYQEMDATEAEIDEMLKRWGFC